MRQYGRLKVIRLSLYSVLEEPSINEAEPINGKKGRGKSSAMSLCLRKTTDNETILKEIGRISLWTFLWPEPTVFVN